MVTFRVEEIYDYLYRAQAADESLPVGYLYLVGENDDGDDLYDFRIEKNGATILEDEVTLVYDKALHWLGEALSGIIGEPIEFDEGT